ncbi:MAG TPA: CBS domain-containing protein [Anaerolineae bacterium]|nr:CBS domain-containing protein [Anaerolineae bacterium]
MSIFELNYLLSKLTVEKIMTRKPLTISPNATIRQAARLMLDHKIGGLPVMDGERLTDIFECSHSNPSLRHHLSMPNVLPMACSLA